MDAPNFAYWLNGFAELNGDTPPTEAQWKSIREHLALVFEKVTPAVGVPQGDDQSVLRRPTDRRILAPWWEPQTTAVPGTEWVRPWTTRCASGAVVSPRSDTRTTC